MQAPKPVNEDRPADALAAGRAVAGDSGATLAALQARGAGGFDPVGFRFVEALARRTARQSGSARPLLEASLTRQLALLEARFEQARAGAGVTLDRAVAQHPAAADRLRQCHAGGDFKRLDRLAAALDAPDTAAPLADLLRHIDRAASAAAGQAPGQAVALTGALSGAAPDALPGLAPGQPMELKAVRFFRRSWARLSVDRRLTRSIARVPEQAGPLNSQRLVLRSLQLMREVSPAYLERFMSYVDALMWLEQAGSAGAAPPAAGAGRGEAHKKRKPGRGRSS